MAPPHPVNLFNFISSRETAKSEPEKGTPTTAPVVLMGLKA